MNFKFVPTILFKGLLPQSYIICSLRQHDFPYLKQSDCRYWSIICRVYCFMQHRNKICYVCEASAKLTICPVVLYECPQSSMFAIKISEINGSVVSYYPSLNYHIYVGMRSAFTFLFSKFVY
jgi:hypothetical protein